MIHSTKKGQLSVEILFFGALTVVFITGLVFLAVTFFQTASRGVNRAQAFAIAEAGVEYYRWHLAHAPADFTDGTGGPGPYTHPYYNKDGVEIGQFVLDITPPSLGSTLVIVRSTGKVSADPSIARMIEVKFAVSSFARYAIALNNSVRFGEGTEVFGEIFSNGGIRFDGLAHNLVQSAQQSYDDPDHGGANEFGVHTHKTTADPLPPAAVPDRPDVFMAGRNFPVPALDFTRITQDLASLKAQASSSGLYFASSTAYGYELALATSGAYTVYRVDELTPRPPGCTNTSNEPNWGTWSVESETSIASGTLATSSIFFFEDDVWVRGQVGGRRVTVASGRFPDNPSTRSSITVNTNLLYTNYDGTDAIALIAQNDFNVGLFSDDILRIDAAIVAQNGRVGRHYYQAPSSQSQADKCGPTTNRARITLYGSLISNQRYGFGFTDLTGYLERVLIYDPNLLYSPPPSFPLTSDEYVQISWTELQ